MPLRGLSTYSGQNPLQRSAFRTSFFTPDGAVGAHILECQVIDTNRVAWTVDVITKYDQKKYFNIQVCSPYMHWKKGEGIYALPDVGAKGHVCLPSDGSPPYLLDFIMPMETTTVDEAVNGPQVFNTAASLAGGRTRAKPGDLIFRGRDDNFLVLHRGGVLQIGATELAQRIYIPLQNLITDVSQNYDHLNTGGSMRWFVDGSESDENPGTVFKHTLRLQVNDEKASLRIVAGKVRDVIREPDSRVAEDLIQLGFSDRVQTVCEVALSPEGFHAGDGSLESSASSGLVLRYFFDEEGNCALRTNGALYLRAKRLRVRLSEDLEVNGQNVRLIFGGLGRLEASASLDLSAGMLLVNGGKQPVATVGSQVQMTLMPGTTFSAIIPPATAPVVCTIVAAPVMTGTVMSGVANFLA